MFNATHTLFGLALARAGGDRLGRLGTATCVIGANLPDADIVGAPLGGQGWYLCHHRGVTHSVAGVVVQALALAGLMWALGRWRARRDDGGAPDPPPFGPLLGVAFLALSSHLLLDALNTYGVRPWLPFSGTWYYGDVAFIVDPWLWICFGGACALAGPRTRFARNAWWGLTGIAIGAMLVNLYRLPWGVPLLWASLMATVLVLRQRGVGAGRRAVPIGGMVAACAYLAVVGALGRVAAPRAAAAAEAAGTRADDLVCHPTLAIPWRFYAVVADEATVRRVDVDVAAGVAAVRSEVLPRGLDDPAVAAAADTYAHHAWRVFARIPFAARAGDVLILGDARYLPRPRRGWCNLAVPLPPAREPAGEDGRVDERTDAAAEADPTR